MVWLTSAMGLLGKFFSPVMAFISNRWPILVEISVEGFDPPHFTVRITNKSDKLSIFVHSVGVSYGNGEYSRSLILHPSTSVKIEPKNRFIWQLRYEAEFTIIAQHYTSKVPPSFEDGSSGPGIESPADLCRAIANGDKNYSWVDLDFNEYRHREYRKGKLKPLFSLLCKQMGARNAKRKMATSGDPN